MNKLKKLSVWLNANGFKKESLVISGMFLKYAACNPPFDKSLLNTVRSGQDLKIGSRGPEVGYMQTLLEERGHTLNDFGIDCLFGTETKGALEDFQTKSDLESTGELDGFTLALLEEGSIFGAAAPAITAIEPDKDREETKTEKGQEEDASSGEYWDFSIDDIPSDWSSSNFSPEDLMSRGNRRVKMHKPALRALNNVASMRPAGKPVLLTNQVRSSKNGAYRDPEWNNKKSGTGTTGPHTKGWAFDIHVSNYTREERLLLLQALVRAGFMGFGHGRGVIHADFGRKRVWSYGGYRKPSEEEYREGAVAGETLQAKTTKTVDEDFIKINRDLIYPLKTNTNVNLVVFYHGTGYGDQNFVLNRIRSLNTSNTIFLIPNGPGKNYSRVESTIKELTTKYGLTINSKKLGGWSAGSRGFLTATGKGFETEMLADPSPNRAIMKSPPSNVYMEYNPANWTEGYPDLAKNLPILAEKINANGGFAKPVSGNHNDILDSILSKLI